MPTKLLGCETSAFFLPHSIQIFSQALATFGTICKSLNDIGIPLVPLGNPDYLKRYGSLVIYQYVAISGYKLTFEIPLHTGQRHDIKVLIFLVVLNLL